MSATYVYAMHIAILALILPMAEVATYTRNFEAKYTKANVPLWKQRACEKAQKYKANSHYVCDDKDDVKCLPGWQGDLCQVPMCRRNCDPMNGYCQRPGECRCRIGYTGELCDKCIPLPGCQHGDCTKPFECLCRPGWDGLFCTEPTCRQGCHNTRGYCEAPGECRCRIGWAGRNCSDCSVMPGCQHGTCSKPLECNCLPGFTGLLCQTPICNADCHKQHGYCKKPGECRCKVGWTGAKCDQCFPYPGCVNGDCEKPWECNCKPGWGGILCDEKLSFCKEHSNICENNGKCVSLTKEDGNYRCHCKQGYLGKNCEIVDEFLLTSTSAPRITPPPLLDWDDEDLDGEASNDAVNTVGNDFKNKTGQITQDNFNKNSTNILENSKMHVNLTLPIVLKQADNKKPESVLNLLLNDTKSSNDSKLSLLPTLLSQDINGADIIGTATTAMHVKKPTVLVNSITETNVNLKTTNNNVTSLSNNSSLLTISSNSSSTTSTTLSPVNKLDNDKNHLIMHSKPAHNKVEISTNDDDDEDDDEECTDDNDEDCEYVDEEDDDNDDDDK